MGRPSKLTEKQPSLQELLDLHKRLRTTRDDEDGIALMLRVLLAFGHLASMWGLPKISRHRFEYSVEGGRIDLLLFHVDDTATIVEIKNDWTLRGVVSGIGQLCYYAAVLPERLQAQHRPIKSVRRLLCSTLPPERLLGVIDACHMAGVQYGFLPPYQQFADGIAHLRHTELVP